MKNDTTGGTAPASASGKEEKSASAKKGRRTKKQRLQERLKKAGVQGVENMTQAQLQAELGRIKNGGGKAPDLRTENKGVQSLNKSEKAQEVKERILFEEVDIVITERGTGKSTRVKKSAMEALLYRLRAKAMVTEDIREMVAATHEFFDRTLGKSTQEIEHTGEIKVDEQRLPTPAEKAAAKAYLDALEEGE